MIGQVIVGVFLFAVGGFFMLLLLLDIVSGFLAGDWGTYIQVGVIGLGVLGCLAGALVWTARKVRGRLHIRKLQSESLWPRDR
jgi:hypothetical protein